MSKRKGVTLDEKRSRILEIFHDSADVFVLKDIEKLSVKKGVIVQAVKEVLQALVDDDLVRFEKIGASNYYWSFPSEASLRLENEAKKAATDLALLQKRKVELAARISEQKQGKEDSERRAELMAKLKVLQSKVAFQQAAVAQYAENDPEAVEAMRQGTLAATQGANRWLDNVYALQSWCKRQFSGRDAELRSFFEESGLTDAVDYLE